MGLPDDADDRVPSRRRSRRKVRAALKQPQPGVGEAAGVGSQLRQHGLQGQLGTDKVPPRRDGVRYRTGTSTSTFDAVGFHNYDGKDHSEEVQNKFRADCGDKGIYVTEMSGTAGNPLKTS